jgi:enoyl-[acyl-carrier protein] reductase I
MIASAPAKLLEGKKVLIVGIANDHSIAWGCALEHRLHLPRHAHVERHQDGRITKDWGELDFVVHSIAFSPKEALQSRVVDVERDGFLTTMEVSCWSFIRMARSPQIAQSLLHGEINENSMLSSNVACLSSDG